VTVLCVLISSGCMHENPTSLPASTATILNVIADPNSTTQSVAHALEVLHESQATNEYAAFWAAIANDPRFDIKRRRIAVLELFTRHFKPGMTFQDIGLMLEHPTWADRRYCLSADFGAPPPGGGSDDEWLGVCLLFDHHDCPVVWFSYTRKVEGDMRGIFDCLKGEPSDPVVCDLRVTGITLEEPLYSSIHEVQWHIISARTNYILKER